MKGEKCNVIVILGAGVIRMNEFPDNDKIERDGHVKIIVNDMFAKACLKKTHFEVI